MISTTLVDILSSFKGNSDISKAEKYTMILKKILNMQISAFFFLSSCTNFIKMYFDIGDLCVKRLEPLNKCV